MQKGFFDRAADAVITFFLTLVKSCFDLEWYRALRRRPLWDSIRYGIVLHAALSLYATAVLASYLFGGSTAFIVYMHRTFPDDAALKVSAGHLSTNLPEPFEAGGKWFRVVIDTSVEGYEVPLRYHDIDGFLVGRDAIFWPKPYYTHRSILTQQRYVRMEKLSELTITKRALLDWFGAWGAFSVLGALVVYAIVYWLLLMAKTATYVAIASALAALAGYVLRAERSYRAWFAIGLHAVTLPIIVNLAMESIGLRIPALDLLIFLGFVIAVISGDRARPESIVRGADAPGRG